MKKILTTIFMFFHVNTILLLANIWALIGVAFNDSGVTYSNFFELLPQLSICLLPLIIGSIVVIIKLSKKEEFYQTPVWIFQFFVVIVWVMSYVDTYIKI